MAIFVAVWKMVIIWWRHDYSLVRLKCCKNNENDWLLKSKMLGKKPQWTTITLKCHILKKYIYIFISTHPVFKSITSYMIILSTKRFGVERKKEEPNPISFKKYLEACFTRIITCILFVNQSVYYRFFDIDVNIIRGRLRHQIQ